jgi:hypothetical protein
MSELKIKVAGVVKSWQTDLETGAMVPGTEKEEHNTIGSDLKAYLAESMAVNVDEAINNFIASDAYAADKDGIAYIAAGAAIHSHWFVTSLNDGGDGTETYVEFYGYVDGAVTLNGTLQLGYKLIGGASASVFTSTFATYTINEVVPAARRFHFYWKVTMS